MRKLFMASLVGVVLVLLLVGASPVQADDDVVSIGWQITNLRDQDGVAINYLELDVAFGKRFFMAEGVIGFPDGNTTLVTGSGYLIDNGVYFKLLTGTEILMVYVDLDQQLTLSGTVRLYNLSGNLVSDGLLKKIAIQ